MQTKKSTFLLVDGNAIVHRAFHALPASLTDRKGRPTGAVFGFARILMASIKQFKPNFITVAYDVAGPTFRDKLFDEYKAKRVKAPQELYDQIPVTKEFLESLNIPHFGAEGFEADDIIGTLSKRIVAEHKDAEVVILTGDGDTLQLVNHRVKVAMPQRGVQPPTLYDSVAVAGKYGLQPKQIIDFKALRGDASDNIPGVKGIGEKTAVVLLKNYQTVENVYKDINKVEPASTREKLMAGKELAKLSKELATIKTDMKLDFKLSDTRVHDYDREKAVSFLEELGMRSLISRLPENKRGDGDQTALF